MLSAKSGSGPAKIQAVVLPLTVALCLMADLAHASIAADFNGDGVLDAVDSAHPETNIVIHVSGAAPQILKLSGRIIAIVAADIKIRRRSSKYATALSERRGLHVWLNKAGHGRFAPLSEKNQRLGLQIRAIPDSRDTAKEKMRLPRPATKAARLTRTLRTSRFRCSRRRPATTRS